MVKTLENLFDTNVQIDNNLILLDNQSKHQNQAQTNDTFSEKWKEVDKGKNQKQFFDFQHDWYLKLYGFNNENDLKKYLSKQKIILDAGCGLGYKAAWFAEMSPESLVIGMDYSDSAIIASQTYKHLKNLFFIKGDIAQTHIKGNSIDYVSCDQVIMHTENPEKTFQHLSEILKTEGEFACYVYAKKALPRELLDDYFRSATHNYTDEQMWEFADQLTVLGKRLSDLKVDVDVPDIPLLGIKGGKYDIQRFIYWNFLKCFWDFDLSKMTNFDWYAPSNAKRFSKQEFEQMINKNQLQISFFHQEEACFSGRFKK